MRCISSPGVVQTRLRAPAPARQRLLAPPLIRRKACTSSSPVEPPAWRKSHFVPAVGGIRPSVLVQFQKDSQNHETPAAAAAPTAVATRNILIAVDLSSESETAVDWAVGNLLRTGDAVHLFHLLEGVSTDQVFSTPSGHMVRISNSMAQAMEEQARRTGANKAQQLHARYTPHLENLKVSLHAHVLPMPRPASKALMGQALCDQADALNAAVVVVASHSHGGLTEFICGSVADWAARHCKSPVAILHDPLKKRAKQASGEVKSQPALTVGPPLPRELVVAVDASDTSLQNCRWILDNMYNPGDCIHLVHVVPCLPLSTCMTDLLITPGFETDPGIQDKQRQVAEHEAQDWQAHQAKRFKDLMEQAGAAYTFDTAVVPTEDPVSAISGFICNKAEELQAAAVVCHHHEHTALYEFLIGSVSNQVAHHCTRPVVVLHSSGDGSTPAHGSTIQNASP